MPKVHHWLVSLSVAVFVTWGVGSLHAEGNHVIVIRDSNGEIEERETSIPIIGRKEKKLETITAPADNRVQVHNTAEYPWSAMVAIETRNRNRSYHCSGSFIGPGHVLTAAHCVYCSSEEARKGECQEGWLGDKFIVTPGRSGNVKPFGSFIPSKVCVAKEWTDKEAVAWDIALFILEEPVGKEKTGVLGLKLKVWEGMEVNFASYPEDAKPPNTLWRDDGSCKVAEVTSDLISHTCDTVKGSSGAPIYAYYADGQKRYVVAVHTGPKQPPWSNRAVRINETKLKFFDKCQSP